MNKAPYEPREAAATPLLCDPFAHQFSQDKLATASTPFPLEGFACPPRRDALAPDVARDCRLRAEWPGGPGNVA